MLLEKPDCYFKQHSIHQQASCSPILLFSPHLLHTLFSVADKKKSAFYLPAAGSKGNNTSFFPKQKTSDFLALLQEKKNNDINPSPNRTSCIRSFHQTKRIM
jgi:hypothetical protein